MPKGKLEHVNISVTDPERSAALLQDLLRWKESWRGDSQNYGWTIHVGDDHDYLALYTGDHVTGEYSKGAPLNHVAFTVVDLDGAKAIVAEAGLKPFGHDDYDSGKRFYFFDWDRIEFEVVSYAGGAQ